MFTLEEYPQVLVEELDLPQLKQGDVQVVFRPSFHVECAITLSRERLDFRTFDGSMWLYLNAFGVEPDKTLRELLAEGNCAIERTRPFLVSVERRAQPDAATSVLEKLPTAELDEPEGRVVIDGMPVWIDVMGEDEQWRLWDGVAAAESPSGFDCFGFLRSLLSCAREVLRMPLCVHRLESLEEYIHEKESPFLDSGGDPPRCSTDRSEPLAS